MVKTTKEGIIMKPKKLVLKKHKLLICSSAIALTSISLITALGFSIAAIHKNQFYQQTSQKVIRDPDVNLICDNNKKYVNCYQTESYIKVTDHYIAKFRKAKQLNSIVKMRLASAYSVYRLNHEAVTNIANNQIVAWDKYKTKQKSYDDLLEQYIANQQNKLAKINQFDSKQNFTRFNFETSKYISNVNMNKQYTQKVIKKLNQDNDGKYQLASLALNQLIWHNHHYV